MLAPSVLYALEAYIDDRIGAAVAELPTSNGYTRWLTLVEGAELAGCSVDALRMRVNRGRYRSRRTGSRLYVLRGDIDPEPNEPTDERGGFMTPQEILALRHSFGDPVRGNQGGADPHRSRPRH